MDERAGIAHAVGDERTDSDLAASIQDLLQGFFPAYRWRVRAEEDDGWIRIALHAGTWVVASCVLRRHIEGSTLPLWYWTLEHGRTMVRQWERESVRA